MSAAGVSASTSTTIYCHSHPRRKSSTPQAPVVKRDNTPHFYIPGEATTGLFPGQKDAAEVAAAKAKAAKTSSTSFLTQNRLWNLLQSTLKKGIVYFDFLLSKVVVIPRLAIIDEGKEVTSYACHWLLLCMLQFEHLFHLHICFMPFRSQSRTTQKLVYIK